DSPRQRARQWPAQRHWGAVRSCLPQGGQRKLGRLLFGDAPGRAAPQGPHAHFGDLAGHLELLRVGLAQHLHHRVRWHRNPARLQPLLQGRLRILARLARIHLGEQRRV
ncbi:hypothetical protein RZS08_44705, partial [Arthrospira platensis SPKY1]|nr:hypothetical protein [Arthrospira platensis SPKY1]